MAFVVSVEIISQKEQCMLQRISDMRTDNKKKYMC